MKKIIIATYIILGLPLTYYLLQPDPDFPEPIPNSIRSTEPGDMETPLRRAYYTDSTRSDTLGHYQDQMSGNLLPAYRLNYPPEEAQVLIRDQTRSTFLEEIVQPFRYSFFVNGYEPVTDNNKLIVEGKEWRQKVTVKYIPSTKLPRLVITLTGLLLTIVSVTVSIKNFVKVFLNLNSLKKWIFR